MDKHKTYFEEGIEKKSDDELKKIFKEKIKTYKDTIEKWKTDLKNAYNTSTKKIDFSKFSQEKTDLIKDVIKWEKNTRAWSGFWIGAISTSLITLVTSILLARKNNNA